MDWVKIYSYASSCSSMKVPFKLRGRTMILSILSSLALVSGLMVVRAKNLVHSVLFPISVFRNTSSLLLLLGLDFFAMIFLVIYIGAIAVSFLFVVVLFHIQIAEIYKEVLRYLPVSGIIGLIFWWKMFFILDNESIRLLATQRYDISEIYGLCWKEPLGYDALLLEYHGIEYPDLPKALEKAISAFWTVKGNSYVPYR
ncbi:NADH dehydrogenase subunit 6, mitochondrion [Artemisia annua]|uniref:NADH dehydrogenase subunit 6, mitochondrion n=1 Tax=Artemisia annua TaxID=35608 RepID=A0A2U1MH68_ARTAN|nr:NADH dehydrogenase subunit 6, mitochondrion [Artemisia annua]